MVLIDLQKVLGSLGLVSSIAKPAPLLTGPFDAIMGLATDIAFDESNLTTTADGSPLNPCDISPYNPSPVSIEPFDEYNASRALVYRYRQQQSVNLGSWFVQEQWMNPSLFTCASGRQQAELDVASGWGNVNNARQVLERHWDTWITEEDFTYLATIGINTVRLPIGYWSLGPVYCQGTAFESVSPVYTNSWARVVRAIQWAQKYDLGVLVDLHGAPGSQNGQSHSGTADGRQELFDNPTNVQLTLNALTYLTQQLVKVNNVVGIQVLNEPSNVDSLPSFYSRVLSVLRRVSPEAATFPFYIHDAFDMSRFADYISTRPDFVVLDHHSYFVFGDEASRKTPAAELALNLRPDSGSLSGQMRAAAEEGRRNIVVAEYSCALAEAALANSSSPREDRQLFCTGQMQSYANTTAGWSFWSYKTEGCAGDENWCFKSAIGRTLPSTFFSLPQSTSRFRFEDTRPVLDNDNIGRNDESEPGLPTRALLPTSNAHQHRFLASTRQRTLYQPFRREGFDGSSSAQYACTKGYADGIRAAKTFAAFNGSKLGFTGQFMDDALAALGSSIMSTDAQYYRQSFLEGLSDMEADFMRSIT